jgi:hypothetical protein
MPKRKNEIKWGNRMIKLTVQFWTNSISPKKADLKTAEFKGAIHVVANPSRGLVHDHIFFEDKQDFFPKMKKLLDKQKIKLVSLGEYKEVDYDK